MSTVTSPRAPADVDDAQPVVGSAVGLIARQWRRPLRHHAVALAFVLMALMPVLGTNRLFHVDEGATLAQTELLARGDGWTFEHPRSDLDPTDRWSPLWPSTDDGSAPLAKHPVYSLLLTPATILLGPTGAVLMSLLAAWGAAVVTALIARRLEPGLARPTLWIMALASPLVVYGFVTVAHTLGALAAGCTALAALAGLDRPRARTTVAAGALAFVTVMLRSEGIMFVVALAAALIVVAVKDRRTDLATMAVVVGGAGLIGYLAVDPWLTTHLVSATDPFVIGETRDPQGSYVISRFVPTLITVFLPGYGGFGGLGGAFTVLTVIASAAGAWILRRRPDDVDGVRLFMVAAAVAAAARVVTSPSVIPGLLMAFPLIVPALILLRRPFASRSSVVMLGVSYALFVGTVLATQYRSGGSGEWGFRYAIVGLPVLVPLVVASLRSAWTSLDATSRGIAVASLAVICATTTFYAIGSVRNPQGGSAYLVSAVEEARAGADRPIVVTNDNTVPRFAWDHVLAGESWLRVPELEMPEVIPALVEDGGDVVLVSEEVDEQLPLFEGTHRVVSRTDANLSADREIVVLTAR